MPAAKIFTEHYTRFQTKLVHKFYRRHMENIPDSPEGVLLESLLEGSNSKNGQSEKYKKQSEFNEKRPLNFRGRFIYY